MDNASAQPCDAPTIIEPTLASGYCPSGRIAFLWFFPLLGVACFIAFIMAIILCLIESSLYYYIITPVILSLPVFAAAFCVIRFGKCRNKWIGALTGTALLLFFYVGYWKISYLLNIVLEGPDAVEFVKSKSGVSGLAGYFIFRSSSDKVGNYLFFGIEFAIMFFGGLILGYHMSGRVFYEGVGRWASRMTYFFNPHDAEGIFEAISVENWEAFFKFPNLPKIAARDARTPMLTMTIEYLKKIPGQPIYLSLTGANLGKIGANIKTSGKKVLSSISKTFFKQKMLSPELAPLFQGRFPELDLPTDGQQSPIPVAPIPQAKVEYSSGFAGTLQKAGIISGAKTTGPDFREKADKESLAFINSAGSFARPTDLNRSLCYPLEKEDLLDTKYLSKSSIMMMGFVLLFVIISFGLLGLAAYIEGMKSQNSATLAAIFGILGFLGMILTLIFVFSIPTLIKNKLKYKLTLRRVALFQGQPGIPMVLMIIEDPATYHIAKNRTEDAGLCLLDKSHQRILIEGFNHRYIILGRDVASLKPIDAGMNPAVELTEKIGEADLKMILHPMMGYVNNVIRPIWAKSPSYKLEKSFRDALY